MDHAIYIIAPGGEIQGSVIAALDLFNAANRIAARLGKQGADATPLFDLRVVADLDTPDQAAESANKGNYFSLQPDGDLADIADQAVVYLASPMLGSESEISAFIADNQRLIEFLRASEQRAQILASHCSGVFLLAEAGLLDKRTATTAWYLASAFKARYPQVVLDQAALLTEDKGILCAGARTAGNDLVLNIIQRLAGRHYARLLAKYMLLDNQRQQQAAYEVLSEISIDDPVVASARNWIRKNLAQDFCVEDIADHVELSSRTLIRRFRNSIDESPQSLTQKLRIEKSKVLLETTLLPLHEIIVRVGYSDERAFRRLFNRLVRLTPNEYRQRFNTRESSKQDQFVAG